MEKIGIGKELFDVVALPRFVKPATLLIFLGVFLFFGIISVILNYHWTQYGIDTRRLAKIRRIYFGVSALFLLVITGLLISILT